jgi:hypothetical protein
MTDKRSTPIPPRDEALLRNKINFYLRYKGDTRQNKVDAIMRFVEAYASKRERAALARIGEPLLTDFDGIIPTSEQYEWAIKVIRWYNKRLAELQANEEDKDV